MQRPEDGSQVSFCIVVCLTVLKQDLSLSWKLIVWLGWLTSGLLESAASTLQRWSSRHISYTWLFVGVLEIQTQAFIAYTASALTH